jgi:hypothetical protein
LKAPRLIARSSVASRQVGDARASARTIGETDCDLTKTPKPVRTSAFGPSCHSSRVKGAAAGGDNASTVTGRHGPGGRLAQLVRALP